MSLFSLRFLQVSDLHLDSSLAAGRLGLSHQKRSRINRDILHALARAIDLARAEDVDVVLVPGDLWDDESVTLQSATAAYDLFASLAPTPVIIAPGNHDPFHAFSYHHPSYYLTKVGRPHPENVVVFDQAGWQVRRVPGLPNVDFYGCCFTENRPRTDRIVPRLQLENPGALNIVVLHGSRDDLLPPETSTGRLVTAPFSREELLASGVDYAALGHYHRHSVLEDEIGNVRASYGGIPVARGLDETGQHFVLVGEVQKGGVAPDALHRTSLDPRNILMVDVPIDSGITNGVAVQERIASAVRSSGAGKDDIVYVKLHGRTHPEITHYEIDPSWCDKQCFHLVVDQSQLEPDHDIDALLADETADKRIEGRFAQRMREMLGAAEADAERAQVLRMALNLGLDALQGRELRPRLVTTESNDVY